MSSCSVCRKKNVPLFLCGECKQVIFCSETCQRQDFRTDKFHQQQCKRTPKPAAAAGSNFETEFQSLLGKFERLVPKLDFEKQFPIRQQKENISMLDAMEKESAHEKKMWNELDKELTTMLEQLLTKAGASCEQSSFVMSELSNYDSKNKSTLREFVETEPRTPSDNLYPEMQKHLSNILIIITSITEENIVEAQTKIAAMNEDFAQILLTETGLFYATNIHKVNQAVAAKQKYEPVNGLFRDFYTGVKNASKEAGSSVLRDMAACLMWRMDMPTYSDREGSGLAGEEATERFNTIRKTISDLEKSGESGICLSLYKGLNKWADVLERTEELNDNPDKDSMLSLALEVTFGIVATAVLGYHAIFNFNSPADRILAEQQHLANIKKTKEQHALEFRQETLKKQGLDLPPEITVNSTLYALENTKTDDIFRYLEERHQNLTATNLDRMNLLRQMANDPNLGSRLVRTQLKQSIADAGCSFDETFETHRELAEYVVKTNSDTPAVATVLNSYPTDLAPPKTFNSALPTICEPDVWLAKTGRHALDTLRAIAIKVAEKVKDNPEMTNIRKENIEELVKLVVKTHGALEKTDERFFAEAISSLTAFAQHSGAATELQDKFNREAFNTLYGQYDLMQQKACEIALESAAFKEEVFKRETNMMQLDGEIRAAEERLKTAKSDPIRNPMRHMHNPVQKFFSNLNNLTLVGPVTAVIGNSYLRIWSMAQSGSFDALYESWRAQYASLGVSLGNTFFQILYNLVEISGTLMKMILVIGIMYQLAVFLGMPVIAAGLVVIHKIIYGVKLCCEKFFKNNEAAKKGMEKHREKHLNNQLEAAVLTQNTYQHVANFASSGSMYYLSKLATTAPGIVAGGLNLVGGISFTVAPVILSVFNILSSIIGVVSYFGGSGGTSEQAWTLVFWGMYSANVLFSTPDILFYRIRKALPFTAKFEGFGRWLPPKACMRLVSKGFLVEKTLGLASTTIAGLLPEFGTLPTLLFGISLGTIGSQIFGFLSDPRALTATGVLGYGFKRFLKLYRGNRTQKRKEEKDDDAPERAIEVASPRTRTRTTRGKSRSPRRKAK